MKKAILILALAASGSIYAQKKTTTSATVSFDATTKLDALPKAENKTVIAAIDPKTGSVAFEAQVKGFNFGNPMMQEHFNGPKWMDSEKMPTATFKGKITNPEAVKFDVDGTYTANIDGELTMHGITKPLSTKATITVKGGAISTNAEFTVKLADYGISNAGGKLADDPTITVAADFK